MFLIISSLVIVLHLFLFGFRLSKDAPFWFATANFFLTGDQTQFGCWHCFFSPVVPFVIGFLSFFSLSYPHAYLLLNILSYLVNAWLLYHLTFILTKNARLSLVSSVLFAINFWVQYLTFSIMPDSATWTAMLLILIAGTKLWENKKCITYFGSFSFGVLISLAVLVKTNLAFLWPLTFVILPFRKIIISSVGFFLLAGSFYLWSGLTFGHYPWESLMANYQTRNLTIFPYFVSFVSAYLYYVPLVLIGLMTYPFLRKYRRIIFSGLILTMIPIFLWPYPAPRFVLTTFWFFLPLAASGLLVLTRRNFIFLPLAVVGLYLLNTLRVYLTFSGQSHFEWLRGLFGL